MIKVGIRADGGKSVGMGHIMRCLSLAKAFRQNGHKVCFFSKLAEGIEKIKQEKFEVVCLSSTHEEGTDGFFYGSVADLANEADEIIAKLDEYQLDVLFIDTYNVNKEYFLGLKPHVGRLAYIDDINKFPYPVDILINGNITGEYMGYEKYFGHQLQLIGPRYNMIRDEFRNLPQRIVQEKVAEIMITTGGSDHYNMTGKLLEILLNQERLKEIRLNVIVGTGFASCKELVELSRKHDNVFLYANTDIAQSSPSIIYSEISDIMLRSDLAISAGGSTLYELAACGTPTLAFWMADNQEFIVQKMDEFDYVKSLGWYKQLEEHEFVAKLVDIISDYQLRFKMSRCGQSLVDGAGTERIVQQVVHVVTR